MTSLHEAWARVPRFASARVDEIARAPRHGAGGDALQRAQGARDVADAPRLGARRATASSARRTSASRRRTSASRSSTGSSRTSSPRCRTSCARRSPRSWATARCSPRASPAPLNDEQREFVETIRSKSEQLLGLIMSLLDLSKLESGTMPVRVAPPLASATVIAEARLHHPAHRDQEGRAPRGRRAPGSCRPCSATPTGCGKSSSTSPTTPSSSRPPERPACGSSRASPRPAPPVSRAWSWSRPLRPVIEVRVADTGIGIPTPSARRSSIRSTRSISRRRASTAARGSASPSSSASSRRTRAPSTSRATEPTGAVFVVTLPAGRTSAIAADPRLDATAQRGTALERLASPRSSASSTWGLRPGIPATPKAALAGPRAGGVWGTASGFPIVN